MASGASMFLVITRVAGSKSFSPDPRSVRSDAKAVCSFKVTAAKVRLAIAAMGQKETKVTDLCSELAIIRQTLYRHLAPDGDAFSGAQDQLDNGSDRFVNQVYYGNLQDRVYNLLLLNRENAYVAGKLNWNGRDLYVQVYIFANREGRRTNLVKKDRVGALVDIMELGPAHPPTALVTSEQMASEINRTGRIALYGLYFDTNRIEIKSESKPTLEQIADLLKREPSLKLLVVGHTDNVGDFESNRNLSQRRAESVANALVTGFGIAPDRLVPFGVSYAAPVAPNTTAEGKSQNRRVELVRY